MYLIVIFWIKTWYTLYNKHIRLQYWTTSGTNFRSRIGTYFRLVQFGLVEGELHVCSRSQSLQGVGVGRTGRWEILFSLTVYDQRVFTRLRH